MQTTTDRPAIRLDAVTKRYGTGAGAVTALAGVSMGIERGSFTAVMGPSGSGKSTFLHCAAGLDQPTSGSVWLGGTDICVLKPKARTRFRRDRVGFIFQAYNLLPALSVEQNITLPLLLARRTPDPAWLREIAAQVGLADLLARRPSELSGGQQQRVAIARALITRPEVVFADEPTGALDSRTAHQVLELLRHTSAALGQTVVMVTHDPVAAAHADQAMFLADGKLVGRLDAPTAQQVSDHMTNLGTW